MCINSRSLQAMILYIAQAKREEAAVTRNTPGRLGSQTSLVSVMLGSVQGIGILQGKRVEEGETM